MNAKIQAVFHDLFERHPALKKCEPDILSAFQRLAKIYQNGGKVLICGNGGSASDSEHIATELMKSFCISRPLPDVFQQKLRDNNCDSELIISIQGALPAIPLMSQASFISAFSNDVSYKYAFAQQVYAYGKPEDALIAVSTSGSSVNVINACKVARAIGMSVVGLTGESGGGLPAVCDVTIRVPAIKTERVQEYHLPAYHAICEALELEFFGG